MSLVRVDRVTKDYWLGSVKVHALRGVSLSVEQGEFLAIAGPSGSGKTTLLNLIGCIEQPTTGQVHIDGLDVAELSADQLADIRSRKLGFVFQTFNLLPVLTALENVEYPLLLHPLSASARRNRARQALQDVGLAQFENHRPMQLSGGQRQRVAIARAMITEPLVVLADEPTANLDRATGLEILQLMRSINQTRHTTFMFSTHDPQVLQLARRTITLSDGAVAEEAPAVEEA